MNCPYCGHDNTWVVDTRFHHENNTVRRRRECTSNQCEKRFTTYEHIEHTYPKVIKKRYGDSEQKIQSFAREKIAHGVRISVGAGTTDETVQSIIESICRHILREYDKEIHSHVIADIVMHEIGKQSPVGHVRFACEYLDLSSLEDVKEFIQKIEGSKRRRNKKTITTKQ